MSFRFYLYVLIHTGHGRSQSVNFSSICDRRNNCRTIHVSLIQHQGSSLQSQMPTHDCVAAGKLLHFRKQAVVKPDSVLNPNRIELKLRQSLCVLTRFSPSPTQVLLGVVVNLAYVRKKTYWLA